MTSENYPSLLEQTMQKPSIDDAEAVSRKLFIDTINDEYLTEMLTTLDEKRCLDKHFDLSEKCPPKRQRLSFIKKCQKLIQNLTLSKITIEDAKSKYKTLHIAYFKQHKTKTYEDRKRDQAFGRLVAKNKRAKAKCAQKIALAHEKYELEVDAINEARYEEMDRRKEKYLGGKDQYTKYIDEQIERMDRQEKECKK